MSVVTLNDDGFIENQPGGRVHLLTFDEAGALSGQLRQVLQRTIEEGLEPSEGDGHGATIHLHILLRHDMAVAPRLVNIEWEANMMRSVMVAAEIPMQQVSGVATCWLAVVPLRGQRRGNTLEGTLRLEVAPGPLPAAARSVLLHLSPADAAASTAFVSMTGRPLATHEQESYWQAVHSDLQHALLRIETAHAGTSASGSSAARRSVLPRLVWHSLGLLAFSAQPPLARGAADFEASVLCAPPWTRWSAVARYRPPRRRFLCSRWWASCGSTGAPSSRRRGGR